MFVLCLGVLKYYIMFLHKKSIYVFLLSVIPIVQALFRYNNNKKILTSLSVTNFPELHNCNENGTTTVKSPVSFDYSIHEYDKGKVAREINQSKGFHCVIARRGAYKSGPQYSNLPIY